MAYHSRVLKDLFCQLLVACFLMPMSFYASAMVAQRPLGLVHADYYDQLLVQIFAMMAKFIVAPAMVFLAAHIATKIKSAADQRIDDPKRTKFYIGIVAAFGVWFLVGWLYNLPYEARMPIVLTATVLAPPILVNVYGYLTELKTLASLRRLLTFFSRLKSAMDQMDKDSPNDQDADQNR